MKSKVFLLLMCVAAGTASADPLLTSWITDYSTKYARIYLTDAAKARNNAAATWRKGSLVQRRPAYCGVQQIAYSTDWVYITTTGLGSLTMGPWYNNTARTVPFVNLPVNQRRIFRFPRTVEVPTTKVNVMNEIGLFVDGVHGYDATDATSYSTAKGRDGSPPGTPNGVTGDGIWNRDAYINEYLTFDPALAHQQNTGDYHYHADPVAPRYLLGDHVDFNGQTKALAESPAPPSHHSPIIGWAKDGVPIYGPYAYVDPMDATSGLKRMVSGFVPRDGQHGTANLRVTGRHSLPAWATRVQNRAAALEATQYGPDVSATLPLGRYVEDNDYLGDLGGTVGVDFDLDEFNGRFGVTPEFPSGIYAYFVAITSAGTPAFPYNVGRRYYGTPSGGQVNAITEEVTVAFAGGPAQTEAIESTTLDGNAVEVTWSSVEGGVYQLTNGSRVVKKAKAAAKESTETSFLDKRVSAETLASDYTVTRTGLAAYDSSFPSTGILSVLPNKAAPGKTVTVTIDLDPRLNPPPKMAPVDSASLGSIADTRATHLSATRVSAVFTIPANAAPGPQTVSVTFPGPQDNPNAALTLTLANGFTITQ